MKLLQREYQIPILAPYNVSVFYCKTAELLRVKVFIVLWMWMPTYEIADIYRLFGIVAESKTYAEIACILCFYDIIEFSLRHIVLVFCLQMYGDFSKQQNKKHEK